MQAAQADVDQLHAAHEGGLRDGGLEAGQAADRVADDEGGRADDLSDEVTQLRQVEEDGGKNEDRATLNWLIEVDTGHELQLVRTYLLAPDRKAVQGVGGESVRARLVAEPIAEKVDGKDTGAVAGQDRCILHIDEWQHSGSDCQVPAGIWGPG